MIPKDVMNLAVWIAGFIATLWWNIEWRRFMKVNFRIEPPYRPWVKVGFRVFFVVCMLTTSLELVVQLSRGIRSVKFYASALGVALALFAVLVFTVRLKEWSPRGKQER